MVAMCTFETLVLVYDRLRLITVFAVNAINDRTLFYLITFIFIVLKCDLMTFCCLCFLLLNSFASHVLCVCEYVNVFDVGVRDDVPFGFEVFNKHF